MKANWNIPLSSIAAGLALVCMLSAGCRTAPPQYPSLSPAAEPAESLRVGDKVRVFLGTATPVSEQTIGEDGTIDLPGVGRVAAAGKTSEQLNAEIQRLLSNNSGNHGDRLFFVQGAVRNPGPKLFPGSIDVIQAIELAGGVTKSASMKVRITHVDGKTEVVNYSKALANPDYRIPIRPDDRIFVSAREF